jgi:hypothetical protein
MVKVGFSLRLNRKSKCLTRNVVNLRAALSRPFAGTLGHMRFSQRGANVGEARRKSQWGTPSPSIAFRNREFSSVVSVSNASVIDECRAKSWTSFGFIAD